MSATTIDTGPAVEATLKSLHRLMAEDEDYDEDFLKPSEAACERASSLIAGAGVLLRRPVPPGIAAPFGDGSVFVRWQEGERQVSLSVSEDAQRVFVYFQDGAKDGAEGEVTPQLLASRLDWLSSDG